LTISGFISGAYDTARLGAPNLALWGPKTSNIILSLFTFVFAIRIALNRSKPNIC
jgi:hypothetical protein